MKTARELGFTVPLELVSVLGPVTIMFFGIKTPEINTKAVRAMLFGAGIEDGFDDAYEEIQARLDLLNHLKGN